MTHLYEPSEAPDVPDAIRPRLVCLATYLEAVWGDRPQWSLRDGQLVGRGVVSIRDDDGLYHFPLEIVP